MGRQIHISDHAVLRYLERILEIDIEQLRQSMAREITQVVGTGARKLVKGDAVFVLETTPRGDVSVVTVLTNKMRRGQGSEKAIARRMKP